MIDKASRPYREALALYTRILDDDPEVTADAARERFLAALAETPDGRTIEALCVELGADKLWRDATGKPRQAAARALTGAVLRGDKAGARAAIDATGDDALTVRGAYERGLLDWERIAA